MKHILIVFVMAIVVGFPSVADARRPSIKSKSPGTATALSVLGTFVPTGVGMYLIGSGRGLKTGVALFLIGSTLGPSRGHDYAGNRRRAMNGFLMRTGFWLGGLVVAAVAPNDGWGPSGAGIVAAAAAAGLVTVSALYDIATAARSAREYNRKHGFGGLSVAPTFDLAQAGAGVKLSWRF